MRRPLASIAAVVAATLLTSCAYIEPLIPSTPTTSQVQPDPADASEPLPPSPPIDAGAYVPEGRDAQTPCPYLDASFVESANGQRVLGSGIDTNFDPPACVFWSYAEEPQLQVIVRHMPTRQDAIAAVDWAAPVAATSPASQPEGWSGGRGADTNSSVYAVHKDTTAVIVFSNQGQTVKTETIATQVIDNLGL